MAASRVLFIILQLLTITISGALLAGAFISLYTTIGIYSEYIPVELVQAVGVVSGGVFIVSIIGLVSILSDLACLFNVYFVLSGLQIVFNICFLIFFILFVNGVPTIPQLDDLVNDTITNFEDEIAGIALRDSEYQNVQDSLGCCGVDFESTYLEEADDDLLTGAKCFEQPIKGSEDSAKDRIEAIQEEFPNFNKDAQKAADKDAILGKDGFFCGEQLVELNERLFLILGAILSLTIFFEIISFLCSLAILRYVEKDEKGGFDFENAEQLNNVILRVSARYNPFKNRFRNESRMTPSVEGSHRDSEDEMDVDMVRGHYANRGSVNTESWGQSIRKYSSKLSDNFRKMMPNFNHATFASAKRGSFEPEPPPPSPKPIKPGQDDISPTSKMPEDQTVDERITIELSRKKSEGQPNF